MKGFRLNPNKEYVMKIIEGTLKKDASKKYIFHRYRW